MTSLFNFCRELCKSWTGLFFYTCGNSTITIYTRRTKELIITFM